MQQFLHDTNAVENFYNFIYKYYFKVHCYLTDKTLMFIYMKQFYQINFFEQEKQSMMLLSSIIELP